MTFNNLLYRPKFSFVTSSFGNKIYDICASRLIENVRYYVTSNIHCLTDDNLHIEIDELFLKILKKYKVDIKAFDFTSHRSSFIWKPWLILSQLKKLSQNGILFYLDSGSEISTNRHSLFELNRLIKFASEKGSIFFRNNIDSTKLADSESLNILNYYIGDIGSSHHSIAAGCLILRNDKETNFIIRKWCYLSLIKSGIIFRGFNDARHRHDQVVLSAILHKFNKGVNILSYPIWFDNFLYFYSSILNYPIHTNRNKTNISYINSFIFLKKVFFLRVLGFFETYDFILKILYFIKKTIKSFFYKNIISPELLDYLSDEYENDLGYSKTSGDNLVLYNERKVLKGFKVNNSTIFSDGSIFFKKKILLSHTRIYGKRQNEVINKFFYFNKINNFKIESAILCLNRDTHNLYHFIYDCLINSISYFDQKRTILLGEGLIDLKKKLFSYLGYNIKFIKKNQSCFANEVYLYDLPDYSGEPNKNSIKNLKNFFNKKFNLIDSNYCKNYIIQRTIKEGRSILFTEKQKEILTNKFDFEIVELSKLELIDQMKIFSNAKNIIAAHGSGLAWIFLCKFNTNIIEIRSLVNKNNIYEKISAILQFRYKFVNEQITGFGYGRFNERNVSNPNIILDDFIFSEVTNSII
jgi:hypothetical protein